MGATVGVKVSAFNWRLFTARKERGFTHADLAMLTGIGTHRSGTGAAQRISQIERLISRPTREEMDELAAALDLDVTALFPPEVLALYGSAASTVRLEVSAVRLAALRDTASADPAQLVTGLGDALERAMEDLTEREKRVIRARFGQGMTLEETGRVLGVTGPRVAQIEAKAFRTFRRSSRSRELVTFLRGDGDGRALSPDRDPDPVSGDEPFSLDVEADIQRYAARRHAERAARLLIDWDDVPDDDRAGTYAAWRGCHAAIPRVSGYSFGTGSFTRCASSALFGKRYCRKHEAAHAMAEEACI